MMSSQSESGIRLPDHSHPSDYSDVQPQSYDPEYISQISSRMQVPHRIAVGSDSQSYNNNDGHHGNGSVSHQSASHYQGMSVPEKIVLAAQNDDKSESPDAMEEIQRLIDQSSCKYPDMQIPYTLVLGGENQHIGMRQDIPSLDLAAPNSRVSSESLAYVGLMTPPRTLTLEENFPSVEDPPDKDTVEVLTDNSGDGQQSSTSGGQIERLTALQPPVVTSLGEDSLLLSDDDDGTRLRTQVAKLHRRIHLIEAENERRSQRELVMYPMILGYFVWKVLGWFLRER